jgi:hypothetical protein
LKIAIRILIVLLTFLSGASLLLLCLMGFSFWYLIAACLVTLAGIVGFFNLAAAGGISLPPLIVLTSLILLAHVSHWDFVILLIALAIQWSCTVAALLMSRAAIRPAIKYFAASAIMLAAGFGVDRALTNKVQVHAFEMNWATGTNDPFGTGPEIFDGQLKVIVYRQDRGSTCYDSMYSNELAEYLERIKRPKVHVEYEVFYDFGKRRAYNVRSIAGMLTKDEHPVLHAVGARGGTIGYPNSTGECDR